ncbi:hypothetical protein [Sphingorhabdus sp.]|jgi:hypothetical protein|nr:hypothetical protein [Sphingorhabdus sp.]MDH4399561.1 hypothetical protein [Sphingorhabdus sp.]
MSSVSDFLLNALGETTAVIIIQTTGSRWNKFAFDPAAIARQVDE